MLGWPNPRPAARLPRRDGKRDRGHSFLQAPQTCPSREREPVERGRKARRVSPPDRPVQGQGEPRRARCWGPRDARARLRELTVPPARWPARRRGLPPESGELAARKPRRERPPAERTKRRRP